MYKAKCCLIICRLYFGFQLVINFFTVVIACVLKQKCEISKKKLTQLLDMNKAKKRTKLYTSCKN